jgi:hypothetical protein
MLHVGGEVLAATPKVVWCAKLDTNLHDVESANLTTSHSEIPSTSKAHV